MKLSDFVADYISKLSPRVYAVSGGAALHLNDSICHHPDIQVIACHGEQAATFMAEADYRVSGKIGIVHVTAGPGGTNTMTGLASAWVDSIPLLVIAGQVTSTSMAKGRVRQLGTNELDMVSMVRPITKYAATVLEPSLIRHHLDGAVRAATTGRPGPVWLEIPLDIQAKEVNPDAMPPTLVQAAGHPDILGDVVECIRMLNEAERPVIVVGNGVRLAGAVDKFRRLANYLGVPVLTSWNAIDIISTDHPMCIGRPGLCGDRAGNFAIQNADLILAIGTRLSVPQIGHNPKLFARSAKRIVVDVDGREIDKASLHPDLGIMADAGVFIDAMLRQQDGWKIRVNWLKRCQDWRRHYPVMQPEYRSTDNGVNSYYFIEELAKHLDDDAIVVTDVGASYISAMQSMPIKAGQRLFHSGGVSAMGYGLPASIGAYMAGGGRQVICLTGDGGMMFNLQELQTIAHNRIPIKIFVFCNNGYMTMRATQNNFFKRESISSPRSGLGMPDFAAVADAFGIPCYLMEHNVEQCVVWMMESAGPTLTVIPMPEDQPLIPRALTKMDAAGNFIPTGIEDLYPYLDRDEFNANMIVKPL